MNKKPESPVMAARIPFHLIPHVEMRGDRSDVLRKTLERHFEMCLRCRADLRKRFSGSELALIADVCNGVWWEPCTIPLLYAEAEDGIRLDGLDEKWEVDGPALVQKLRDLNWGECFAIVDAVEVFWSRIRTGETPQPDPREFLNEIPIPEKIPP